MAGRQGPIRGKTPPTLPPLYRKSSPEGSDSPVPEMLKQKPDSRWDGEAGELRSQDSMTEAPSAVVAELLSPDSPAPSPVNRPYVEIGFLQM